MDLDWQSMEHGQGHTHSISRLLVGFNQFDPVLGEDHADPGQGLNGRKLLSDTGGPKSVVVSLVLENTSISFSFVVVEATLFCNREESFGV